MSDLQLTKPELEIVKAAAKEMSNSMTMIEAQKDLQKDIIANMKEKFELAPAEFSRIVKVYHESKIDEVVSKHEAFVDFYDSVFIAESK